MSRTIWNFGWNPATWIAFVIVVVVLIGLYVFVQTLRKLREVHEQEGVHEKLKRKAAVSALVSGLLVAVLIVFFYFGFGPGEPVEVLPASEDGMRKLVEEMPDELPKEGIKQEAYDKKPEALKAQDRGFEKEAEEADDYLDKAIKKAEEAEKAGKAEKAEKGD